MGYKIVYSTPPRQKGSRKRVFLLISLFFLGFAICVRLLWPESVNILWEMAVSHKLSAEIMAFFQEILETEEGNGFSDAVQVFCQEIFGGA